MSPARPRRKRPSGQSEPVSGGSIFSNPDDNVVRGVVLVKLAADGAGIPTASIPVGPLRAAVTVAPSEFGLPAVDAVLAQYGVRAVSRLHPPAPPPPGDAADEGTTVFATAASTMAVELGATYRVQIDPESDPVAAADQLRDLDEVDDASVDRWRETTIVPNDPDFPRQWGLTAINAPAAWDRTTGSASVVVAVIDTGVDLDHPELAPLLVPGRDLVDLVGAAAPPGFHFEGDIVGVDADPMDEVGHGTHVAGTIAASSNDGVGVAGVTWNCRLMPVRVLARIVNNLNPADVRGTGSAADIAAGIRWAVDNGARVINLSLGGTADTMAERDAVAYAVAHDVVVVAAMGNAFQQGNPLSFPAAYPGVVAVGAVNQARQRAAFSQTGQHISISGPGVGIWSTYWNDTYATLQGTSMASPHVAGVAALVRSCNPRLPAAQVADILRQSAQPLRDAPADPIPNDRYGWGLVDAAAAVARACPLVVRTVRPVECGGVTRLPVLCRPSQLLRCPTETVALCTPTRLLRCPTEIVTLCGRTQPLRCPSVVPLLCGATGTPRCGGPPGGPDPAPGDAGSGWDWDPYADPGQDGWGDGDDARGSGDGGCGCG